MADMSDDLVISISTDLAQVRRSLKRLEGDIGASTGAIEKKFQAVGRGINNSMTTAMQQRIDAMTGVGVKAANEWNGVLAEQGKELDRLRARYSPLFATINNYKNTISEIRRAHAVGAISADEMTAAITRERQAALSATAAIKGRNAALSDTPSARGGGSNAFNTSNLAAQGFDIAATAAFMPWYTVALQQGPQVAQVFNDIKASGQSIGPAVAGAFMQLVNPISLITIATIGATAAAVSYFSGLLSESSDASEKLKEQAQLIQAVADKWGEAVPALRDYADQLKRAQDSADLKAGVALINENTLESVRKQIDDSRVSIAALVQDLRAAGEEDEVVKRLQAAFSEFASSANEGKLETEEVKRVQDALAAAIESSGIPALSEFAKFFDGLSTSALSAANSVGQVNDAASRMQPITTWRSYNKATGKFETNAQPWDDNIQYGDNFTGVITPEVGPVPGGRPTYELDALPKAKAARAPRKTASDNFVNDLQAIRDRTAALAQEMQLVGLSNEAQVARRTALDLEQNALRDLREEARRKGQTDLESIKLSPDKIAAINKEAEAYARQAEALRVAQENNELVQSVTKGFVSDMMNGVKAADAFSNALGKIADKLIDDVLNSILQVNSASSGGGGILGSIFGSLFGGGGFASLPKVGPVPTPRPFSDGGFTGVGGKYDPAGIVHKGEFVMNAEAVRRIGVDNLRMLQGYASGGMVGAPSMPALADRASGSNFSMTFAPVLNAQGADKSEVAGLRRDLAMMRAEMPSLIVRTVKDGQKRRAL